MAEEDRLERLHFWELGIWQKRNTEKRGKKDSRLLSSVSQKYFTCGQEVDDSFSRASMGKSKFVHRKKRSTCDKITTKFLKSDFSSEMTLDHKL